MKFAPTLTTLLVAGLFAGSSFALTPQEHKAEKEKIEATYKTAKAQCKSLAGNAKDVCEKQAKGEEKVAKAELKNRQEPNEKNAYKARVARADADYEVAKEKCDDLAGNAKDVCKKDAKAAHVTAVSNAKVTKSAHTPGETRGELAETRKEAAADQRKANYKAAVERCDSLSGDAKTACVANAKRAHAQ